MPEKSLQVVLSTFEAKIERIGELDARGAIIALKPKDDGWKPLLEEQKGILHRMDALFVLADSIEQYVQAARRQANIRREARV